MNSHTPIKAAEEVETNIYLDKGEKLKGGFGKADPLLRVRVYVLLHRGFEADAAGNN